jgi:excisionase family DNA binding protein
VKALAKRLAVSAAWVYQQVDAGSIPHHRRGALIWFEHDEVVEWLQQHRRPLRTRT